MPSSLRRNEQGFGLVELLIALTVLAVGILGVASAFMSGMVTLRRAGQTATATALADRQLERYRGVEVDTTGDGFLAMFDGPARAVRCALAIKDALAEVGVVIRAGVHTSEVELAGHNVRGVGVHIAARVVTAAQPDEVLVTRVVRDLAVGSGLRFAERGRHALKGVPGEWELLSVADGS